MWLLAPILFLLLVAGSDIQDSVITITNLDIKRTIDESKRKLAAYTKYRHAQYCREALENVRNIDWIGLVRSAHEDINTHTKSAIIRFLQEYAEGTSETFESSPTAANQQSILMAIEVLIKTVGSVGKLMDEDPDGSEIELFFHCLERVMSAMKDSVDEITSKNARKDLRRLIANVQTLIKSIDSL